MSELKYTKEDVIRIGKEHILKQSKKMLIAGIVLFVIGVLLFLLSSLLYKTVGDLIFILGALAFIVGAVGTFVFIFSFVNRKEDPEVVGERLIKYNRI